jgi:hypothetical protein
MFQFIRRRKRHREIRKVKKGDGHRLKEYRFWHAFTHSLFHITITNENNEKIHYALKSRYFAEDSSVDLYHNRKHIAYSTLPASLPVENGIIEVKSQGSGINSIQYLTDKLETFSVYPEKRSIRGLRMRLHKRIPTISFLIGGLAIVTLLSITILTLPQIIESISQVPWISENIGTFESPISLSIWMNVAAGFAGALAATERALMLRSHWLID